jgi:peptidoglycan/xylan/chitin deacetylase (PgdA/CDA1 family)
MAKRRGAAGKKGGGGAGAGDIAGKLALYALAAIGGCYLGGKALNMLPHEDLAKSAPTAKAHVSSDLGGADAEPVKRAHRQEAAAEEHGQEQQTGAEKPAADAGKLIDAKIDPKTANDEIGRGEADTPEAPAVTIQEKPSNHAKPGGPPKPADAKPADTSPDGATQGASSGVTAPEAPAAAVRKFPPLEVDHGSTRRKEVALTFDAGSDWKPVRKIVDALAAEKIKTTFFLTGEWVKKNPKSTHLIADGGHELGNHSWDHPAFTGLSDDAIKDQLRRTDEIIHDTVGRSTHPYFRPPLGARDSRVKRVVGDEGYMTIYWTLDSRDSVDKGITAEQIRDRVLSKTGPGSIVLMHCGSQATADALPEIIKGLREKGLSIVPVSRLLQQ